MRNTVANGVQAGLSMAGLVVLALLVPAAAQACTCVRLEARQLFHHSDQLVVARVKQVLYQPAGIGEAQVLADIEVIDTLKAGASAPPKRVRTDAQGTACGLTLQAGQRYLMAPSGPDQNQVDRCTSWALEGSDAAHDAALKQLLAIRDLRQRRQVGNGPARAAASSPR